MKLVAFMLLPVAVVSAGVFAHATAEAQVDARVIDRSLVCTTGVRGGARIIDVSATSGYRNGDRFEWLGQASVVTAGQPIPSRPNYLPTLVGLTAGWPPPPQVTSGGLGFASRLCGATRARVPFSRHNLTGGAASQFGDEFTCIVEKSILIRVRAAFRERTPLRLVDRTVYQALGRIERAQLMVQSAGGRPIVYAEVFDSGRARLFTRPGCTSD